MIFPKKEIVEKVRKEFTPGTRVELISMDDPYCRMPRGLKGTVEMVDDTASIHVRWDNGSGLAVVYGVDSCRKIDG